MIVARLPALLLLLLLLIACAGCVTPAQAHASLLSAQPRDGAMLAEAPAALTLTFNEPVAPLVFRVVTPNGETIPLKADATNNTVTLSAPAPLAAGTHVLSWRVVSADGHPVGGSLIFSIGHKTENAATTVSAETDNSVRAAIWLARVGIYLGLFIGLGGAFFAAWIDTSLPRAATAVIAASIVAALVALPLSVGFQGLDALAAPLSNLSQPAVWLAGFRTSYGTTTIIAAIALGLGLPALRWRPLFASQALSLAAVIGAALALASSGHASAADPQVLMRPSVFVHVSAIALWAGSLFPLLVLVQSSGERLPALMKFSRTIPFVLVPLLVSGVILAIVQLDHIDALWTTSYGIIFLCKSAALTALAVLATVNRYVLTPALLRREQPARNRMAVSIGGEIALVLAIFALVALWRFTPPPRTLALGEPAFVHIHTEQAMADVTVSPGRPGPVDVQLRLLREDFAPLAAKEVTVLFSNAAAGIEPLGRTASAAGDGTWRIEGLTLPLAGIWTVQVEVLVGDFDKIMLDAPIVIGTSSRQ